jgi:hypothetical protein
MGSYGATANEINDDLVLVTADVTFTPVIQAGDVIQAVDTLPRPTGFVPTPVWAVIDVDGRVKLRPQHQNRRAKTVRLLADQPLLNLESPLCWRVSFSTVRFNGKPGAINEFVFQAPNVADTEINLITVGRRPGQPAVGTVVGGGVGPVGPPGPPGPPGPGLTDEQLQELQDLIAAGGVGAGVGPAGADGKDGTLWFFGDGAPGLLVGARPGDAYLDVLNGQIYTLGD